MYLSALLGTPLTRRAALRLAGGSLAGLVLAACAPPSLAPPRSGAEPAAAPPAGVPVGPASRGFVFNTGSRDVTLFDPATNQVTGTRPVDATVRWLSNAQHFSDGTLIWTYDFPDNRVQAIGIHPETLEVAKRVSVDGAGPGHSFELMPDKRRGFVNAAGSNFLAVVDPVGERVLERVDTGAFP